MAYRWHLLDGDLDETERAELGTEAAFDDRAAAEAWLGTAWPDLDAAGVTQISLYDDDRLVFTMGLEA